MAEDIVDEALTPDQAADAGWLSGDGADLIVLGTPVAETVLWLARLAELGYTGIVSDVASTKRAVVEAALNAAGGYRFVGGHPMAGL